MEWIVKGIWYITVWLWKGQAAELKAEKEERFSVPLIFSHTFLVISRENLISIGVMICAR